MIPLSKKRLPVVLIPPPMAGGGAGSDVRDLQVLLRDAGLYGYQDDHGWHDYAIDGNYGTHTRNGVFELQVLLGVQPSAHWHQDTYDAMVAATAAGKRVVSGVLCESEIVDAEPAKPGRKRTTTAA